MINESQSTGAVEPTTIEVEEPSQQTWLEHNKYKLAATGAYLGAAALAFTELGPIKDQLAESVRWTVPAIAGTESVATAGLAAMVTSTGHKIGNPLTLRSRLKSLNLRGELKNSRLFRTGAYLNLAGAAGTSGIITAEALEHFPVDAWPASLGIAGLSVALSLPFFRIARGKKTMEAE